MGSYRRNAGRKAAAALGTAVFFVLAMGMVSFAEEGTDTFVTGTRVNGIGIGGLDVDAAKERIEGFYAGEYTLSIKKRGGGQDQIKGTDIDYKVTVPEELSAILDAQNASGRNSGPSVDNTHTLAMTGTFSQEKLTAAIQALPSISGEDIIVTSDARISAYAAGEPFTVIPAVQGNNVDVEKTAALITQAVQNGETSVDLEAAGCYYTVSVWETSPELTALCDAMNQLREREIQYVFGENRESLSGETMASWITGSQGGVVSLDQTKLTAYVTDLAARYDTAGTARTFTTVSGAQKQLTGPYGWKIDVAGEMAALTQLIQSAAGDAAQAETAAAWNGNTLEREPVYSATAAARGTDWGTTYAEVDLTGQHVYMIKDGAVVWDAPCVTGNLAKNYDTPAGIYSLTYKQKDRVLRGAKQADGSYEYETPVDYWMPFNGGIGFHDANWRGEFGGAIYKTNGSHGCVNLPPSKAAALYELVYKGMPVICYE